MVALSVALEDSRGRSNEQRSAMMPSFTFLATAEAAIWCGLKLRLLDISSDTWHLDPILLERLLRARREPDVVVAVSAFGTPPCAETRVRWERICRAAGVPLIVDSAAAFGAVADDGTPVGAQGDIEVVSFHATKPFAIGEGGAVFTRHRRLYDQLMRAVNFGLTANRSIAFARGLNAKMSELHAAAALAVLDDFDAVLERRREAATRIRAAADLNVSWQSGCELSTWQFVPVAFSDRERRVRAVDFCHDRIEVRTYYQPLHTINGFRPWSIVEGDLSRTDSLYHRILCLPMANDLSEAEQEILASVLRRPLP